MDKKVHATHVVYVMLDKIDRVSWVGLDWAGLDWVGLGRDKIDLDTLPSLIMRVGNPFGLCC
jgi:hypothetical protein